MRNKRQHYRDEHHHGNRGVYHPEIEEAEHARGRCPDFLRPMRSEIWPDSGMVTNETTEAAHTAPRSRLRDICKRADCISEDKRSEDVERRLLRQPQQSRQDDLLPTRMIDSAKGMRQPQMAN